MNLLFFSILFLLNDARTFNILALYPNVFSSHLLKYEVLFRELQNRGHNVMVISNDMKKGNLSQFPSELSNENKYMNTFKKIVWRAMTGIKGCQHLVQNKKIMEITRNKAQFDVIMLEQFNNDCALGIANKLGSPVVATTSHILKMIHYEKYGIPANPTFVPYDHLEGWTHPNFLQRLDRVFFQLVDKFFYWLVQRSNQKALDNYFGDTPPLEDLAKEIKFVLVYQHPVLTGSRLLPPNVIEVGGYHVRNTQPLSGELKTFVDEAEHGIIYICLGTVIDTAKSSLEKTEAILGAIREFPLQRFIMKLDDETLIVDKNQTYISRWLPQIDILGHPKTLAFISHAGMGGTSEAIHFGVPMIAMPLMADQPQNAAAIEECGLGVKLLYKDLTKETLVTALRKVLEPEFRAKVKEVSSAWHDRPQSPLDTAVFWIEFAARHPSLSFRSPATDVPFYQYFLLDVIGAMLLIIFTTFWCLIFCCKKVNSFYIAKRDFILVNLEKKQM